MASIRARGHRYGPRFKAPTFTIFNHATRRVTLGIAASSAFGSHSLWRGVLDDENDVDLLLAQRAYEHETFDGNALMGEAYFAVRKGDHNWSC